MMKLSCNKQGSVFYSCITMAANWIMFITEQSVDHSPESLFLLHEAEKVFPVALGMS